MMFWDQAEFMQACGQTVGKKNDEQLGLYIKLIEEELDELRAAYANGDRVSILDAVTDLLVVCIGAGLSHFDPNCMIWAWNEVWRSNMAKIDPKTGMVKKREDGKILKPEGWRPPNLKAVLVNCEEKQYVGK